MSLTLLDKYVYIYKDSEYSVFNDFQRAWML